jgi:hypothetical protein
MNVEPGFLMLLCKIYGSFGTLGNPEPLRSDRLSNATGKPQTVLLRWRGLRGDGSKSGDGQTLGTEEEGETALGLDGEKVFEAVTQRTERSRLMVDPMLVVYR